MEKKPVGLTGGIASGKSVVSAMFRELGDMVIDGDGVAARVLCPGSPAVLALEREFGPSIINHGETLNRAAMLEILRHNHSELTRQLQVLAPFVLPAIDLEVRAVYETNPEAIIIVEAPLLMEYGRRDRYGPVIVVAVPREIQIKRLMERSGKNRAWAESVVDIQMPLHEKISRADHVIDNSGILEETRKQVIKVQREIETYFFS